MVLSPRELLTRLFDAAVQRTLPARCLPQFLPDPPRGRTVVIGAGKAAAAMARALEQHWPAPLAGVVVTRYGYAVACQHVEVFEAAHPVPDAAGVVAATRLFDAVANLTADDLVIALVSGGGSALLPLPGAGVSLDDERAVHRALLACGASLAEVNGVRRQRAAIHGGRLAAACAPARIVNLVISDVPGDRPFDIASGPTVADPTTCADALEIAHRYRIDRPAGARRLLESGAGETLKPGDTRLPSIETRLIATAQQALEAAAAAARAQGITPLILGDRIEGEAREVAKVLAAIALQVRDHGQPAASPCVLLSGGEVTVSVRGHGCGGPNVECALALAIALAGAPGIHALMADTDGVDGQAETAGAFIGPATLERARDAGMRPRACLDDNDAHAFFARLDDAWVTGPTLTNVNDFRAILII